MKRYALLLAFVVALPVHAAKFPAPQDRLQFILISFDSTPVGKLENSSKWKFIQELRDYGKSLPVGERSAEDLAYQPSMTLFINTKFLQLKPSYRPPAGSKWERNPELLEKYVYSYPDMPADKPVISWGNSPEEIEESIQSILELHKAGIEIGSHTVRHYRGSDWSFEEWDKEFALQETILDKLGLPTYALGMRAPFLGTNDAYFKVMEKYGMKYDTSKVSIKRSWPRYQPGTQILEVPVLSIYRADSKKRVLHFGSLPLGYKKDPQTGKKIKLTVPGDEYREIFMREFNDRYNGNREPFYYAGHGEKMGDTLPILKRLCFKPNVRCASYRDLYEYIGNFEDYPR